MSKKEKAASGQLAAGAETTAQDVSTPNDTTETPNSQPANEIVIRDMRTPGWFWIRNEIIDRFGAELGPYGLAIYAALCRHADKTSQDCYPSYATLARETGMKRRQAIYSIQKLQKLGLIAIEERYTTLGDRDSNLFVLLDLPNGGGGAPDALPSAPDAPGVVQDMHQGGAPDAPKQDSPNKTNIEQDMMPVVVLLAELGIAEPTLSRIAEKKPAEETVRAWVDYAREQSNLVNPAGFIATRLLAGDIPPMLGADDTPSNGSQRNGKKTWYTEEDAKQFLQPTAEDRAKAEELIRAAGRDPG